MPRSKRLLTDDDSNLLLFLTGHGGKEFLKFQDASELSSHDLADALAQMHEKRRFKEVFLMVDTCEAASMYEQIRVPGVVAAASSLTGEKSYSHHADSDVGVAVIDRFTFYSLETLETVKRESNTSMKSLFDSFNPVLVHSTPGFKVDTFQRDLAHVKITEFFGNVQRVQLSEQGYAFP